MPTVEQLLMILVCLLVTINVGQALFYMFNVQRLVDKVMSRNYYEVVQADKLRAEKKNDIASRTEDLTDDYSTNQAKRANSLFGISV